MATNNAVNANSTTPLPIVDGGTGVNAVTTAAAATTFAGWDANKNLSANSHIDAYTTTATAAGTTTLTVASTRLQYFTGSTTQTVTLPVTSTLVLGQQFYIANNSSGVVTVQSSGGNTIIAMAAGTAATFTCILTSGTGTASWSNDYTSVVGVSSITGTANQVIASASTGAVTLSLPQSIATSSAVEFASVQFSGNNGLIDSNNKEILQLSPGGASVVNNFSISNAATGTPPILAVTGSDTNVAMDFQVKAAGTFAFISSTLANYVLISPAGTGNPVAVSAFGSDTNVSLYLQGKGNSGVSIQGVTSGGDAAAGYVGELISSVIAAASSVSLTNNTSRSITSISLTAGDWDVYGNVSLNGGATTILQYYSCWTGLSVGTPDPSLWAGQSYGVAGLATFAENNVGDTTPYLRVSISSNTTVYLAIVAGFTTSTCTACGGIYARRVR